MPPTPTRLHPPFQPGETILATTDLPIYQSEPPPAITRSRTLLLGTPGWILIGLLATRIANRRAHHDTTYARPEPVVAGSIPIIATNHRYLLWTGVTWCSLPCVATTTNRPTSGHSQAA